MIAKFDGINKIIKELDKGYAINVGIMGEQATTVHKVKNEDGELVTPKQPLTNAFIGAVHEFGSISHNIPARSFLRMPLRTKLPEILKLHSMGMIRSILENRFPRWLQNLAMACENVVQDAFDTSGFGTWQPLKPATLRHRKKSKIAGEKPLPLVDTGQLRSSISSEVVVNEN